MAHLDLYVVIAYMVGILAVGSWAQRKATTQDQFLVAGRSVGPWLYSGTLAAIVVGGASTVGGVKLGYQYGISGLWFVFMFGLGILVLSTVFVKRILGLNLYTVSELLERRYTASARVAGGVVMVAYDLMVSVTATIAVGSVMEVIVGVPRTPAILMSSAVMVAYSVLGGMWSLTLTDIIQFVIKTIGILFVLLPGAIIHAGGFAGMHTRLPSEFFSLSNIGLSKVLSFFVLYFFGIIIGQDVWQRVFTARSVQVASNGGIGVGLYCLCYALAGALIGAAGVSATACRCGFRIRRNRQRGAARGLARAVAGGSACGNHVDGERMPVGGIDGAARGCVFAAAGRDERGLGCAESSRHVESRRRHDLDGLLHARCDRGDHGCL
jgi:SSS family solute:Na+ symporter